MPNSKSLFDLIVAEEKLNSTFARIRSSTQSVAARAMLDDVFQTFHDHDGNFLEQFQTTGFDTRFFELYLYAYFSRTGYTVDLEHAVPDFIVERSGIKVAVEATTVNPSVSGIIAELGKKIEDLSEVDVAVYLRNELPIRFGSPLYSKLQKADWKQPHCSGFPFVISIEAFHDRGSLHFSDTSLTEYLYGLHHTANWGASGELVISQEKLKQHSIGSKTITSGFFTQPGTENISAVLFTNSGTHAKFSRMGYQSGFGNDVLKIKRFGRALDLSPDAMDSILFSYDMDDPPMTEPWGQGLVVITNPNAVVPLPTGFFEDAQEHRMIDGKMRTFSGGWHPFNSTTVLMNFSSIRQLPDPRRLLGHGPRAVSAITQDEFWSLNPNVQLVGDEDGWYSDEFRSFLGLLVKSSDSWTAYVFARDFYFNFFPIANVSGLESRYTAVDMLQHKIMTFLKSPRRLFSEAVG